MTVAELGILVASANPRAIVVLSIEPRDMDAFDAEWTEVLAERAEVMFDSLPDSESTEGVLVLKITGTEGSYHED